MFLDLLSSQIGILADQPYSQKELRELNPRLLARIEQLKQKWRTMGLCCNTLPIAQIP